MHAVMHRLLQNGCPETDILKVQILRDIARIFAVGNKLHFFLAAQIHLSGRKLQRIKIFPVAGNNTNRSAFSIRLLFHRYDACHRVKML